jgi:holin-like protein
MLAGLTWLLVFQCFGEVLVRLLQLPVPGPVAGMVLLFVALRLRRRVPDPLGDAADGLLRHLSLLFVPAGVGVMLHFSRLADEGVALATSLVVSTVLAIAVSALVMRTLIRRRERSTPDSSAGSAREP